MRIRNFIILIVSILCYAYVIHWQFLIYLVLSGGILLIDKLKKPRIKKTLSWLTILLLICGFPILKGFSNGIIYGYSVFSFSAISYIVDQIRNKKNYSSIDTLIYLFFFPKMMAGPIVRAADFIPQLSIMNLKIVSIYKGGKLLIYGFFLKMIIADNILYSTIDGTGLNLLMQSVIFGIQFYIDFYSYSIIAVGLALCLGITMPYNFDNPYSAQSFKDFWKKWNITLSSWLKDYIYIPLGGNHKSKYLTQLNVLITFIISGLWHGLSFPFIFWGICHALLVNVEKYFSLQHRLKNKTLKFGFRAIVITITILLWQLFRFEKFDDIIRYCNDLFQYSTFNEVNIISLITSILVLIAVESKIIKHTIFGMSMERNYIIVEVTFLSIILMLLLLCPFKYTFNFFYFNF